MSIGTLKAEQLSSKVILTCESCSYKTSQHRPSKARQKLAVHMTGHSNVQKEPTGPTDAQEGLDSEGGHSAPEAEGVDDNGEYSSQQMLTDSECNDQVQVWLLIRSLIQWTNPGKMGGIQVWLLTRFHTRWTT